MEYKAHELRCFPVWHTHSYTPEHCDNTLLYHSFDFLLALDENHSSEAKRVDRHARLIFFLAFRARIGPMRVESWYEGIPLTGTRYQNQVFRRE